MLTAATAARLCRWPTTAFETEAREDVSDDIHPMLKPCKKQSGEFWAFFFRRIRCFGLHVYK